MKYVVIAIGVFGVVIGLFLWAAEGLPDAVPQQIDAIHALQFTDMQGNTTSLDDLTGKPLVVNTWATWCPFCKKELPDFAQLQAEYADQVQVIAINRSEDQEVVRAYLQNQELEYGFTAWLDPDDQFYKAIGGFSMPETLFVNAAGEVVNHHRGFMTLSQMQTATAELLNY